MKKNKLIIRFFFAASFISTILSVKLCAQNGFLPTDITGLKVWLTGDSVQTTVPPFINKCFDLSANANHAMQATAINQPTSASSSLNGHRVMQFDGTEDYLQFNEIADIRTVFWVIKEDNGATSNFRSLLGHGASAYDFVRGDNKQIWNSSYSNNFVLTGVTRLNEKVVNGAVATIPAAYSIISLVTTGNVKADNFTSERNLAGRLWDGELAELIIYNQPLTSAEVTQVETYLHNKYAPPVKLGTDITVAEGFCDTTLNAGEWFTSFLWSTGETTQKITVNKSGTYWVKAVDVFDRLSQDTIQVTYPSVNYTGNVLICPGSLNVWDTKLSKKKYTFQWQDNSTDSIFTITQAGNYYVKITDAAACSTVSDTAKITMDNIAGKISLGNDTAFCSGNTIGLTKGAGAVTSYLWSTGSTNSTIPILISGTYWVTVKSINNCSASDTIHVVVTGTAPVADFSFSNTCFKNTTVFKDLSASLPGQPIVSWNWNFGDLHIDSIQHPVHAYADTGKYTVKLTVRTGSCAASVTKQLQLYPRPKIDFTVAGFFQNIPTAFTAQASTFGYPIADWTWNFGDPGSGTANTSALQNPNHVYTKEGTYSIKLIASNIQGCTDTVVKTIFIDTKATLGEVPQLKVWLRADTLVTLNPNNTINTWKDIKGGAVFTSATLSQSPLLKADVPTMNDNAYANFNGSNGMLSQTAIKLKNNLTTVLVVGQLNAITTYGYWVCYGVASAGNWELYEIKNSGRLAFIHSNDNLGAGIDGTGSGSGDPAGNTTVLDKHPSIVMGTVNPSNAQWSLFENFTNKHTAFSGPFTQAVSSPISLGYRTDVINYANFKMAELMIFDSALTVTQFTNIKNYLQKRYSKKVSLGADIAVSYGFCDTFLKVSNPVFASCKWSTGDTTKSIGVHKTGTYWVDVTDIYGFHSFDTVKINYPAFSKISNATICPGDSIVWDTHLSKKGYVFKWQNNSTDSLFTIKQPGNYVVKITDTLGCSIVSDTVKIQTDGIATAISLGADISLCSGNVIGLTKGAAQAATYLWSTGSTASLLPISTSGKYWVTVKSVNNCPATDTIQVTVAGIAPTTNFVISQTCFKNTTIFTDQSVPPSGESIVSWNWDFGDSFTSFLQDPTHSYADTGKYTVKLTVKTAAGCSATLTKIIHVYPRPKIDFLASDLCEDTPTSFSGKAITYGYAVAKWKWSFGDPASGAANTSSLQSPVHLFGTGGTYPVTMIAENMVGCTDTLMKNLLINAAPAADFTYGLPCKNDSVTFKDLSVLPAGTTLKNSYWNFGSGTSTLLNPKALFTSSITYTVMHIVTANNGCKDTAIKKVEVHAKPVAKFNNDISCVDVATKFNDLSFISTGSIVSWKWSFEGGVSAQQHPQYVFKTLGNKNVKQVVTSDFGCKDSIVRVVTVNPRPAAEYTYTPQYGNPGVVVKFTNTSTGASTYTWDFNDGGTSQLQHPSHTYTAAGNYFPSLTAVSAAGCRDTVVHTVDVVKRLMDVALKSIVTDVQKNGTMLNNYLNVHVDIENKGSADIFALDLFMEVNNGTAMKETWTGKLAKGAVLNYDFRNSPSVKDANQFVCIYALNPNGLTDEFPADNKVCTALDEHTFKTLDPYPNPSDDETVLPLIIPKTGNLDISLYDAKGNLVKKIFYGVISEGLQLITVEMRDLEAGIYACNVDYEEQLVIKKIIKK